MHTSSSRQLLADALRYTSADSNFPNHFFVFNLFTNENVLSEFCVFSHPTTQPSASSKGGSMEQITAGHELSIYKTNTAIIFTAVISPFSKQSVPRSSAEVHQCDSRVHGPSQYHQYSP